MKVLIISDIHGNAEALRAVAERESDADQVVFLGDSVLSGPQANETMELLVELDPDIAIMGNHDEEVLDPSIFAAWPDQWVALNEWILADLDPAAAKHIRTYQANGAYEIDGKDFFLHHGELPRGGPKALPDEPDAAFSSMNDASGHEFVLFGHTHVQFSRTVGATTYINPGSIGQPRCGKLHACYGVFQDGQYEPRQVTYDPEPWLTALDRIDALDAYPDFKVWLREGLVTGYGIGQNEPWTRYAAEGYA